MDKIKRFLRGIDILEIGLLLCLLGFIGEVEEGWAGLDTRNPDAVDSEYRKGRNNAC